MNTEVLVREPKRTRKKSGDHKDFWESMLAFQKEAPRLVKRKDVEVEGRKSRYSYKFVPLDDVIEQVLHLLNKHGIVLVQSAESKIVGERLLHRVTTHLVHATSGTREKFGPTGFWASDIHEAGSVITHFRRYGLLPALGLAAADEDDDGKRVIEGNARRDAPTEDDIRDIERRIKDTGADKSKAMGLYNVTDWAQLTRSQLDDLVGQLKRKAELKNGDRK